MNVNVKVINLKWHMFRPFLGNRLVSVDVKELNSYPVWIHIMGYPYTIQYHTCNKTLRVIYYFYVHDTT
jgi:hypothetical protein